MKLLKAGSKNDLLTILEKQKKLGNHFPVIGAQDKIGGKKGAKSFLGFQNHTDFIQYIRDQPQDQRVQYEVVFGDEPCVFYVDIDHYDDCVDVVQTTIDEMTNFLKTLPLELNNVKPLVLESIGGDKGSFHILWRADYLLATNCVRKHMFNLFQEYLIEQQSPLVLCKNLCKDEPKKLLDPQVYGTFQNFRAIGCTKLAQNRPLLPKQPYVATNDVEYFLTYKRGTERILTEDDLPKLKASGKCLKKSVTRSSQISSVSSDDLLDEYDSTLANAFHEEVISTIRDDSVDFLLKCIPNAGKGQSWNVWIAVGMAVHRIAAESTSECLKDVAFKLFDKWSATSNKYDVDQTNQSWKSLSQSYRKIGYNKGTLYRLAKQSYPQIFKADFSPFTDFIPFENLIIRYNEQFVRPYSQHRLYFEMSAMGTGKTFQIAKFIAENNPKRVICLSPKQSFATNFCANLNEALGLKDRHPDAFINYLDLMKRHRTTNWHKVDRIVIQMESLYKVDLGKFEPYDLLIADECESLLKCFSSKTMEIAIKNDPNLNRLEHNMNVFRKVVYNSTRCIFADAFLSRRTLDTISCIRTFEKETTCIRINEFVPDNRIALKYTTFNSFQDKLLNSLDSGKRVVVFWGSKKKGKEFESHVKEQMPHVRIKFYHADADDKLDADLEAVNDVWTTDVDLLMYTAKITVGVNYTVKDYFEEMFVYGYAGGACARDVCQSILRVRFTKSNTLHYFVDGRSHNHESATTYNAVDNLIKWKFQHLMYERAQILKSFFKPEKWSVKDEIKTDYLKDISEETWSVHLHVLNTLEDNLSSTYYHETFEMYLKASGYEIVVDQDTSNTRTYDIFGCSLKYVDIPECADLSVIEERIERKSATAQEKLMYRKARFDQFLNPDIDHDLDVLQGLWERNDVLDLLMNQSTLKKLRTDFTKVSIFTTNRSLKLHHVRELCSVMNISDVLTETHLDIDTYLKGVDYVKVNLTNITKTFQWTSIGIDKQTDKMIETVLKRIFEDVCYSKLTHTSKVVKVKIDAKWKSKRVIDHYVLKNLINERYKCDIKSLIR